MGAGALTFNIFGRDVSASSTIRKVAGEAEGASAKTSKAGKLAVGAAAVGLLELGKTSVESAVHFEKGITLLQTAAGESSSNLKVVSDGVLAVSNKTGIAAQDLTEGMFIVEKGAFRGADGLKVLQAAAEGATAEGADMSTMTTALTSILSSYHLKASDAATVTSQMDRAAGLSKTTMQNFAGSLSTVLPIASSAGLSFAQVGGAIATLTSHGTSADEATQELNATIRSLTAPNQVAQKEMQQLGINVADLTGNLGKRGLTGTLDIVVGALGKTGPGGKILLDAFKKSGAAGKDMQVMLTHMDPTVRKLSQSLLDGGISQGDYVKKAKSMTVGQFAQMKQFDALKVASSGFNDVLKSGSPATQSTIDALKKMMGGSIGLNTALMLTGENAAPFAARVKEIGSQAGTASGDIKTFAETQGTAAVQQAKLSAETHNLGIQIGVALLPAYKWLLEALTNSVAWLKQNWSWFKFVALAVGALAAGFKALKVIREVGDLMNGLQLVKLFANPVGIVILAVAALVVGIVLLWKNCANFRNNVTKMWADIKHLWTEAVQVVVAVMHQLGDNITRNWATIKASFSTAVHAVSSFMSGLGENIKRNWSEIKASFSNAIHAVGGFMSSLGDNVRRNWSQIRASFSSAISAVVSFMSNLGANIKRNWNEIRSSFAGAVQAVAGFMASMGANISRNWHQIVSSVSTAVRGMVTAISSAWTSVGRFFSGLWGNISGWLSSLWGNLVNAGRDMVGRIVAGLAASWGALGQPFVNLGSSVLGWIGNIGTEMWNVGVSIVQNIINGIGSVAANIGSAIRGAVGNAVSSVGGAIRGAIGGIFGHHAKGGTLQPGWSIVGEEGPESVFTSGGVSTVFSNPSTSGGLRPPMGSAGGGSVRGGASSSGTQLHVHFNGVLAASTADQAARQMADMVMQARRRGVIPRGAFAI